MVRKRRQYTTGGNLVSVFLRRLIVVCLGVGLVWSAWSISAAAHEIPADVVVHVYVRSETGRTRVLVRVPLESMRDVIIPTTGPGFLLWPAAEAAARLAAQTWIVSGVRILAADDALEPSLLTAVQLSQPSDRSFESWDQALAHVTGPSLSPDTRLLWTEAWLDVALEFPPAPQGARLALETDFARLGLRTQSVVRFITTSGVVRVLAYTGDAGRVELDPTWWQAARRFVMSGTTHILSGVDHLLFLVCLVVPARRFRSLVILVTAFTVAHSLTLVAAAFGVVPSGLWFPPFVEMLIAVSIFWMALENIVNGANAWGASRERWRWGLTFLFGLVHGFGFSFALRETLQFAGSHLVTSLVAFNLGVELGQLAALAVMVPALALLFRYVVAERIGAVVIFAIIAHEAWHWMLERGAAVSLYGWPFTSAETTSGGLRLALASWLIGWGVWWVRRRGHRERS